MEEVLSESLITTRSIAYPTSLNVLLIPLIFPIQKLQSQPIFQRARRKSLSTK